MYVYVDSKHFAVAQNSEYLQFQWWISHNKSKSQISEQNRPVGWTKHNHIQLGLTFW